MQKKKWTTALLIAVIMGVIMMALASLQRQASKDQEVEEVSLSGDKLEDLQAATQYSEYAVDIAMDQKANLFKGIAQVSYTHDYERVTQEIVMHIGPIGIKNVQINLENVPFKQKGSSLVIDSPFDIEQGEELTLMLEFQGFIKEAYMYHFIPTLVSYDEDSGWAEPNAINEDYLPSIELANYEVRIHTQKGQYPLGTGAIEDVSEKDNIITTSFKANRVRGFGLFLGEEMERTIISTQEGSCVVLYHEEGDKVEEELIPALKEILTKYSDALGMYPYDQLTVIHKKGLDAQSYPTLITGDFSKEQNRQTQFNTLIGRQWLTYIIGVNEEDDQWFNAGLLDYLSKKFSLSPDEMKTSRAEQGRMYSGKTQDTGQIASHMFYDIETRIGEEKFIESLRAYYKNNSFKMSAGDEFVKIIQKTSDTSVLDIYNYWNNKIEEERVR